MERVHGKRQKLSSSGTCSGTRGTSGRGLASMEKGRDGGGDMSDNDAAGSHHVRGMSVLRASGSRKDGGCGAQGGAGLAERGQGTMAYVCTFHYDHVSMVLGPAKRGG